jgi:hypothetical protein
MMAINKLLITNTSALVAKYGKTGNTKISKALKLLIAADAQHGLVSKVIALDSKTDMAKYGAVVSSPKNARASKAAIDAIYAKEKPDYIVILGASDVVPLVQLKNPVYSPNPDDDNDKTVPSDLPYACDTPYGTDINSFVGPTRVVGRLPDLIGASNPQYLLKLLQTAASYKTLLPGDYQQYFGISAKVWTGSTKLSLSNMFGNSTGMKTIPASGPNWTGIQLAPRIHFINCHGGDTDTNYYGQPPGKDLYPIAHSADLLPKKIIPGTILAAECCYGAQLYNPGKTSGQAGIAYTYLGEGAYGVFGSTTIAYGSSSSNSSADLICQFFILSVMAGASLGRAVLEARHQFAGQYSHLNPTDLKTLAQYYLLGDPSIHAAGFVPHGLNNTKAFKSAFARSGDAGPRTLRRERLHRVGTSLHKDLPSTHHTRTGTGTPPSREISRILVEAAQESGLREHINMHFHVTPKARVKKADRVKRTIHLLMGTTNKAKSKNNAIKKIVAIIATAENGKLMHLRRLYSR